MFKMKNASSKYKVSKGKQMRQRKNSLWALDVRKCLFIVLMYSTMQNNSSLKARYTSFELTSRCLFDITFGYFIVMLALGLVDLSGAISVFIFPTSSTRV